MPQKKNPDFASSCGKIRPASGDLVTLLTLMKGLPYAYDRDLQEIRRRSRLAEHRPRLRAHVPRDDGFRPFPHRPDGGCLHRRLPGGYRRGRVSGEEGLPFRKAHEVAALIVRTA
jgi:argininosuccinate lyase